MTLNQWAPTNTIWSRTFCSTTVDQWPWINVLWSMTFDQWPLKNDLWKMTFDQWPLINDKSIINRPPINIHQHDKLPTKTTYVVFSLLSPAVHPASPPTTCPVAGRRLAETKDLLGMSCAHWLGRRNCWVLSMNILELNKELPTV